MRGKQREAAAFALAHGMDLDPWARSLDLGSELGELFKEMLKSSDYAKRPLTPTDGLEEELGDCAFSLLCLAEALGLDLEKALDGALRKYEKRFAERGHAGSER